MIERGGEVTYDGRRLGVSTKQEGTPHGCNREGAFLTGNHTFDRTFLVITDWLRLLLLYMVGAQTGPPSSWTDWLADFISSKKGHRRSLLLLKTHQR